MRRERDDKFYTPVEDKVSTEKKDESKEKSPIR